MEQQLTRIRKSYETALKLIKKNKIDEAAKHIHNMDVKDYDLSLDIMYDNNNKDNHKHRELKYLILKVDTELVKYSKDGDDYSNKDLYDNIGDIF